MDRLATRTDPLGRSESYQYDGNGNLTQVTDRKSQVSTFTYDALNRRTQASYADPSTTSYTYDAGNRLTAVTDSLSGTISRTYDSLDRLTQEATPQGTVSYAYDAAGRRTTMTVAGQPALSYAYDTADRLTQLTQGPTTVGFAYDTANRRTSLTLPNGVVVESGYDAASRLTGLTYRLGATTLGNLAYTYDAAGNRTQVGGPWARTGLPSAVSTSSYNGANQQLALGTQTMTYDFNGNVTGLADASGTTTYTWDARNRLTGLTGPSATATFGYDALGRRWTKTVNGARTDFLHDGLNPVQEGLLPATVGANLLTGLGLDELFTRTDVEGTRTLLPDALGSTLALTDPSGTVQTEYTYTPFGASSPTGAPSTNAFQYTGRESDGTGLYYYRARYYHPGLHRFVSEDPLQRWSGSASGSWSASWERTVRRSGFGQTPAMPLLAPEVSSTLYTYVNNNPMKYVDPLGLKPCCNECLTNLSCLNTICFIFINRCGEITMLGPFFITRMDRPCNVLCYVPCSDVYSALGQM